MQKLTRRSLTYTCLLAGARLGEFLAVELAEQFCDAMVEVLGAVVAGEAVDGEGGSPG